MPAPVVQRNIRLLIAYDGTDYQGWQRQRNGPTIQGEIERCLASITNREVQLHGAGRTDAGVHAAGMVANFHTAAPISEAKLHKGLNSMLPADIRILRISPAPMDFHARFSAIGKEYAYFFQTYPVQSPFFRHYALHLPFTLDFTRIRSCLAMLVGSHDFSSFENSGTRDKTLPSARGAVRTIHHTQLLHHAAHTYSLIYTGDGFLRNMVRNLCGTIFEVGKGSIDVADFSAILASKSRAAAGPTAPPHGLSLQRVLYPASAYLSHPPC